MCIYSPAPARAAFRSGAQADGLDGGRPHSALGNGLEDESINVAHMAERGRTEVCLWRSVSSLWMVVLRETVVPRRTVPLARASNPFTGSSRLNYALVRSSHALIMSYRGAGVSRWVGIVAAVMVAACNDECRRLLTCLQATRQCRSLLITYMRFAHEHMLERVLRPSLGLSLILKLGRNLGRKWTFWSSCRLMGGRRRAG